ncbi:MAG TPA: tetratricopeptide repeat protein [Elusimicrobiota bacterium]|nr:tetratricopeptide repeat protein [Elusimicrobiota bacterium]
MTASGARAPTLSVGLIVKNEELLLGQCLRSVRAVVDEIIVVDTGSTDRTVDIARRLGARVLSHPWDGNYGRARNVYIRNSSCDWILVLDADERIARRDAGRLKRLLRSSRCAGYMLPWRDYSAAHNLLSDWRPNRGEYPWEENFSGCPGASHQGKQLRLFKRLPGVAYCDRHRSTHVSVQASLRELGGRIETAPIVLHHFQHRKGGGPFILKKQKERLAGELRRLRFAPRDILPHLNAGKTLFSMGRDAEALRLFKRAAALDPKNDEPRFLAGLVYKETGLLGAAARSLKEALSIKRDNADAWAALGIVHDLAGNTRLAEGDLKTALALRPLHLLARNALGVVRWNQGDRKAAERDFRRALRIHPRFAAAYSNLGRLYAEMGKLGLARRVHRKAIKLAAL